MTLPARITAARKQKGLSQEALGKSLGVSRSAVAQWESGQTTPTAGRLVELSRELGVRFEWLYWGRPPMVGGEPGPVPSGYAWVPVLSEALTDACGELHLSWGAPSLFPLDLIEMQLQGRPGDFGVLRTRDPSMEPLLPPQAMLLLDLRQTLPSPPGAFALWDGVGLAVHWVRPLPGAEPQRLRLSSENPRFPSIDVDLRDVRIIGRVVWFSRKL